MEFGGPIGDRPLQAWSPCYNANLKGGRIASPTAQLLRELQSQNKYLFHGSDTITDLLEPAFTRNHGGRARPQRVFATEFAIIAVFHALARTAKRVDGNQRGKKHGFTVGKGGITLRAEPNLFEAMRALRQPTNIYLLKKNDFEQKDPMEWIANVPIEPLAVVFASGQDLDGLIGDGVKLKLLAAA
ncbi:MAG: hypothetical protein M9921_10100 [Fimbriimonadaceae bacterium]|nr:hypothetical protein [Fimbriimonadaceae bacterium]